LGAIFQKTGDPLTNRKDMSHLPHRTKAITRLGILSLLLMVQLLTSCKTEELREMKEMNDSLRIGNSALSMQIEELKKRITYLKQFEPDLSIKNYSDKEVIQLFVSHNEFYNADTRFKNFKVIKTAYNIYDISYSTMDVSGDYLVEWSHGVSRFTAHTGDKYKLTVVKGPVLASP
jgi:hypothetical protein